MCVQVEGCVVSRSLLEEAQKAEEDAQALLMARQEQMTSLNLDFELNKHRTAMDDLQRRSIILR